MYRVTIYNGSTATVIHEPSTKPNDPHLYRCSLVQGSSGEIDSLSFDMLPNNPGYALLESRTTLIAVTDTRDNAVEFSGRVLTVTPKMETSGLICKSVVCEDRLGFLCDSIQPYTPEATYEGDGTRTGVEEFLDLLLANHNAQVEAYKQIYRGTVSVATSTGNVTKGLNYETTWDCIKSKLLDSVGGEILLYAGADGKLYLDYVPELGSRGSATIEMGKNMRSISREIDPTSVITRLIPLGAKAGDGTEERITIASVNNQVIYLDDDAAKAQYGIVAGVVTWDDVTEPKNLMTKGQAWLKAQTFDERISLSALDLSLNGLEPDAIRRYNYYRVVNEPIGLDAYLRVVKRTVNIVNPTDITYEMGQRSRSMASVVTDTSNIAGSAASDAMAAINAELSKTVATLIAADATITNLKAQTAEIQTAIIGKADIEDLDAVTAHIGDLSADLANVGQLVADKADIEDLEAATAQIGTLSADVANIETILAGNVGTGNLQAIHITGDNVVIDEAVITDAMIASLSASKLTAGTLYTSLIQIASDQDEHLLIDGATLQIKDSRGTVRVQIGQDGSGDYSYYLWDADGRLMWSPTGVTAAGLNDGIIRDINVAEDAAISGDKLDITSVAQRLNEDGSITVEAGQVTIDGTRLDVAYQTITDNTEAAQQAAAAAREKAETAASDAAAAQATADQAQSDAATAQTAAEQARANAAAAQSTADTAKSHAATAQAAADQAKANAAAAQTAADQAQADYNDLAQRTDATETELTAAQLKLDQAQEEAAAAQQAANDAQAAADAAQVEAATAQSNAAAAAQAASQAQTTADAASAQAETAQQAAEEAQAAADAAAQELANIRQVTTTIQTDLSVVQGQIASKVWQTDITSAVNPLGQEIHTLQDQYTTLTQTMDGLQITVGDLTTTVSENYRKLDSKLTEISVTAEGLQTQVSSVQTAVETVQQEAITESTAYYYQSTSATALTGGSWSTTAPVWKEGTYIWVRYRLTYGDGTTSDTTAVCLTGNKGSTGAAGADGQMLYATCSTAAGTAAKVATLSAGSLTLSAGATVAVKFSNANTASAPTLNVASKGAKSMYLGSAVVSASNPFQWSAGATVIFVYNGTYWVVADAGSYQDLASVSETFSSRIEQLADSISLSVTGSLGGTASIVLSVDGQATSKSLDLSKVRAAFANDKSAVTISAGTVSFAANTLVVDSDNFTLDQSGNVTMAGIVTAKAGSKIGGWSITDGKLYAGSESDGTTCVVQIPGGTGGEGGISQAKTIFAAGGFSHADYSDCKFRVTCDGRMFIDTIYTSYLDSNNDTNSIDVRAALYSSYAINCDTTITTDNYFRASDIYNKNTTSTKAAYWDSNGYLKAYSGSSQRHKHDIAPLTAYDPEVLYDLPVKQFVYNDGYLDDYDDLCQKTVPGIIAEDLEQLLPIAVSYDKEGRVEDWKDRLVLCCMLRLLQDQHRELERLKGQIGGITPS